MSKKAKEPVADPTIPEGFEERTSDIVGIWATDQGPIRCIPSHAVVGDGKKFDKSKPSLLIFAKLTAECKLQVKGDEDEETSYIDGQPGDLVGIWAKPGMKDIASLQGVEVFLMRDPAKDKDVGKGNDLKGYMVASKESPNRMIPINTDRRDLSKGHRTFLDAPDYGKGVPAQTAVQGKGW